MALPRLTGVARGRMGTLGRRAMSGQARIPVINTLKDLRAWRQDKRDKRQEVGVVPTMGALHQGHLDLVKKSLEKHPFTVMTLFVNPMQFAPTEDLSKYPRTLQRDLELLSTLLPTLPEAAGHSGPSVDGTSVPGTEYPLVVFAPPTDEMYPLRGELQDLSNHRGVGVEMRGWGDVMEGSSRPQFFKGVATVCTKLFNAVEPDHAYFGQKDIQQALLLKMMVADLLLAHPSADTLHILPTTRDPETNLALSSRNAYLSLAEMRVAPVLYRALTAAKREWQNGASGEDIVEAAKSVVLQEQEGIRREAAASGAEGVDLKPDYFEVFDKTTFEPVRGSVDTQRELVVAGAVWVGTTRLIDNLLLGWEVD